MESKGQGVGYFRAPTLPEQPGGVRQEGATRCVVKDGRKVKVVTIARPGPPRRPVPPHAVAPDPQGQAQAEAPAKPLGGRQVEAGVLDPDGPQALRNPQSSRLLFAHHLRELLEGKSLDTFTQIVHDLALFHDKGATWHLEGDSAQMIAWPPTPGFMAYAFDRVFQPGLADESQAREYAEREMPATLLRELLQGLLIPASLLSSTEKLRAVKKDDPRHAEATKARAKILAAHGKHALPEAVGLTVQRLLASTRNTPRQKAVDTAVMYMVATAFSRLDEASYKRLVAQVDAGTKGGEAPGKEAPKASAK